MINSIELRDYIAIKAMVERLKISPLGHGDDPEYFRAHAIMAYKMADAMIEVKS